MRWFSNVIWDVALAGASLALLGAAFALIFPFAAFVFAALAIFCVVLLFGPLAVEVAELLATPAGPILAASGLVVVAGLHLWSEIAYPVYRIYERAFGTEVDSVRAVAGVWLAAFWHVAAAAVALFIWPGGWVLSLGLAVADTARHGWFSHAVDAPGLSRQLWTSAAMIPCAMGGILLAGELPYWPLLPGVALIGWDTVRMLRGGRLERW